MRPLTEEEAKSLFEKLAKYIGENVKLLLERSDGKILKPSQNLPNLQH